MKISFAALAATVAANAQVPEVQAGLFGQSPEEKLQKQKEDTMWYAAGIKGYYTGFYKAFYKQELPESNAKCLNEETIENMITMQDLVIDPLGAAAHIADIQKDMNMFAQMAEVMENLSVCHFEQSAIDLMTLCTKTPAACSMASLTQNMSKDMFVLIGKMTSLAEVMEDFPSKDRYDFGEQMRELGSTGGTWARVMFNFHHEGEQTSTHHYHHREDYDY